MSIPFVSIIIVTWNTAEVTQRCIGTIKSNLPKSFYEIIIVDNGSTDNTEKLLSSDKTIIYHNTQQNLGFSKGCNIGAKLASSDLLFFLNSDMEMLDNKLIDMVSFYLSHPRCGIIGPKFLNPTNSPQPSVFPHQTPINALKEFWFHQKVYSSYVPKSVTPTKVWSLSGGAILISKKIFNLVSGWNEKYFMYFEDLQLCDDVRRQNYDIYYFPGLKLVHHHGLSGKNLASSVNQWKRLIPSSIQYHGILKHKLLTFIIWSGQKVSKLFW